MTMNELDKAIERFLPTVRNHLRLSNPRDPRVYEQVWLRVLEGALTRLEHRIRQSVIQNIPRTNLNFAIKCFLNELRERCDAPRESFDAAAAANYDALSELEARIKDYVSMANREIEDDLSREVNDEICRVTPTSDRDGPE